MQLVIRDLSKTYPHGTRALKDVSLDVPKGMFRLLDPNGTGKSTLMRAWFMRIESGRSSTTSKGGGR